MTDKNADNVGKKAESSLASSCGHENTKNMPTEKKCLSFCFGEVRFFVAILTLTIWLQGTLSLYLASTLTTMERRYNFNSSQLSALVVVSQVGMLVSVILVAYYGGRPSSHRPRWLGCGVLIMSVGYLIGSLPHFVLGPYQYTVGGGDNATKQDQLCLVSSMTPSPTSPAECGSGESESSEESTIAFALTLTGAFVGGVGYSPLLTLGTAYVDDHSPHRSAALYLGIIYMMWGIGPISGNLIAAACLLVYVDFNRVDESSIELTPSDREWLGAWWVGTFVGAWMLIVVALPYFFIPKRLETKEDCGKREMAFHLSKNEQKFSFGPKGFLKATYRLLKNPLYIFPTLGYAFDLSTTMGILPFIPKYFEEQFGLNPTSANIYTGIFASLPYGLGMILGGYMIKRLNMQTLGMSKFMVFVVAVGTLLCAAFYPLTCGDTYVAGMGKDGIDKTQLCNEDCGCSVDAFEPVCGSDGYTYASPCHAGCNESMNNLNNSSYNYTSCSCIQDLMMASDGMCQGASTCSLFYVFLVFMFLFALFSSLREIPSTMLVMRSVDEKEKSFALGVRFLLVRIVGIIPLPILYGQVIDISCSLWRTYCEGAIRGACSVYDNHAFRRNFVVLTLGIKLLALIMFIVLFVLWKRKWNDAENRPHGEGDLSSGKTNEVFESHTNAICEDQEDGRVQQQINGGFPADDNQDSDLSSKESKFDDTHL